MKAFRVLSLTTIIALLTGVIAACSDKDEPTPEQQHTARLTEQLTGSWLKTFDVSNYEMVFTELQLSEQPQASAINYWFYDIAADNFAKASVPISYQVISHTENGTTGDAMRLEIDTTAFYAQYPDAEKLDDIADTLLIRRIDNDSLLVIDMGEREPDVVAFSRETFDESKTDKSRLRRFVEEMAARKQKECTPSGETDFYSYPDPEDMEYIAKNYPESAAAAAAARRVVTRKDVTPDFKLDSWMSKVDDDELVRNLCIPSAHDCTTYGIKAFMTTFGVSQALDLKDQFRRGVRVFDLRIRDAGVGAFLHNHCYHDCLDCDNNLTDALNDIVEMVTADGSQEGAIAWISPEKNEHFSFATSSAASMLIDYATPLHFDPFDLDRPACVKKAVEEITECLYKKGCMATFTTDMKMKDLRRKVLVLFEKPTEGSETVDWGVLAGKLAILGEDKITRGDGKEQAEIYKQNDWGQDSNQTPEQYIQRKTRGFIDMIHGYSQKQDKSWIFNACNGFISDPLPNYSAFAARIYPTFTKHLNLTRTRGIFQTDYCGVDEFTRVTLGQIIGIMIGGLGYIVFPDVFEAYAFWAYNIAKLAKSPDEVRANILINSMVFNNFRRFR